PAPEAEGVEGGRGAEGGGGALREAAGRAAGVVRGVRLRQGRAGRALRVAEGGPPAGRVRGDGPQRRRPPDGRRVAAVRPRAEAHARRGECRGEAAGATGGKEIAI